MTDGPPAGIAAFVRGWYPPLFVPVRDNGQRGDEQPEGAGPSEWLLVFDTETTTDRAQGLRFGAWQIRHRDALFRQGVFYDPDGVSDAELDLLKSEAAAYGWECCPVREWIDEILLGYAFDLSATVVGHNLFFDISRIAIGHETTKSRSRKMRDGFSFTLTEDPARPRLLAKRVSSTITFYQFTVPASSPRETRGNGASSVPAFRGFFVDTAAFSNALLGAKYSLKRLAEKLDTDHRKLDVDLDGPLSPELIDYAMNDVTVTWECFVKLRDRYDSHRLDRPIHQILSSASIGKAYLEQMNITPLRDIQPDFPDRIIAAVMETYYGGRTESRIRRIPTPGVYVDFLSQYPTVYVLQDLWSFQIAERIDWSLEDPEDLMAWIDGIDVDDVLDPGLWPKLTVIVEVEPGGDVFPTRARYNPNSSIANVGFPERPGGGPAQWFALADVIASKLHTGRTPPIRRAIRFTAGPAQQGLQPIQIAGNPDYTVDPYEQDFINRLIELRAEAKTQQRQASASGFTNEAARWDGVQQGLKIAANTGSYGIGIELNTTRHRNKVTAVLLRPDGTRRRLKTKVSETPGRWFNPIIATFSAAGGRLLYASLVAQVRQRGGSYVFGDTDSLFPTATRDGRDFVFVDPNGVTHKIPTLSWEDVDEIIDSYRPLNPYDPAVVSGSILEKEDINYADGNQREIRAYSIASKRYALVTADPDDHYRLARGSNGEPKRSEHGLGHLVAPVKGFEDELWEYVVNTDSGLDWPEPDWFDQPALGQLSVNTPEAARLFHHLNEEVEYRRQIRPGGFLSTVPPHPSEDPGLLIAPKTSPVEALQISTWINRKTGSAFLTIRTDQPELVIEGSVTVLDYRHYVLQYITHPEWKTADPGLHTRGPLDTRTVQVSRINRIGKEVDPLSLDDPINPVRRCRNCRAELRGRQRAWCSDSCRKAAERLIFNRAVRSV